MKFREYIVKKFLAHKYGVMGTVIFHLVLAIFFLAIGISRMQTSLGTEVELAAPPVEELKKIQEEREKKEEIRKKTSAAEVQRMLRSIAVNENASRQKASSENVRQYIDEVMKELESEDYSGRYQARKDQHYRKDSLRFQQDKKEQMLDSLKSTFYSGESSVSYDLAGRFARFLPIPVFKCEFGGKVVVRIQVDRKGHVQKAEVVESLSEKDDCLHDVAEDAALRARFNEKPDAPSLQSGTVTFIFVKQ